MFRLGVFVSVWFLFVGTGSLLAQVRPAPAQAPSLPLGTVYVGSIVEATLTLRQETTEADPKLEVTAPPFVQVLKQETFLENRGKKRFVRGVLTLAVDTSKPSQWGATLGVTLAKNRTQIPISVSVQAPRQGLTRVLVVESPFQAGATNTAPDFPSWTTFVQKNSLNVSYLMLDANRPVLRDLDLSYFDFVILTADAAASAQEIDWHRLMQFAEHGGRVTMESPPFCKEFNAFANLLLGQVGLQACDNDSPGLLAEARALNQQVAPEKKPKNSPEPTPSIWANWIRPAWEIDSESPKLLPRLKKATP